MVSYYPPEGMTFHGDGHAVEAVILYVHIFPYFRKNAYPIVIKLGINII